MTLNCPQTQQPHEMGFLLCYIKTYKAGTMQKNVLGDGQDVCALVCVLNVKAGLDED